MSFPLVTVEDVIAIRVRMAHTPIATQDAFGEPAPLKPDLLASAVARQSTGFGGTQKYTKAHEIGATLLYGLAMNHPFENGNKRTALVALLVFLDRAGFTIVETSQDELYDLVTTLAAHALPLPEEATRTVDAEVDAAARWLRPRLKHVEAGDRPTKIRDLRAMLEAQGCEFDEPDGNYVKIRRGKLTVGTGYPDHHFTVPIGEIKKIRRALGLTAREGVRTREFYNIDERVDAFVRTYRDLLDRLSLT